MKPIEPASIRSMIRSGKIRFAGNRTKRIYGYLGCRCGKRMKRINRVFFRSVSEADFFGYRPCACCMRDQYIKWKQKAMKNLLPVEGEAYYYGPVLTPADSKKYLDILLKTIPWRHDEARIFGRHIITKRKVAWYGNSSFEYTYSNTTKSALDWTNELLTLKKLAEEHTGAVYNSCLLNLYHSGEEGMAWHSDDEKTLGDHTSIASLSFGAERKFRFKHKKTGQTLDLMLESGSLLLMAGETQKHWLHCLLKSKRVKEARVNLTFRQIEAISN